MAIRYPFEAASSQLLSGQVGTVWAVTKSWVHARLLLHDDVIKWKHLPHYWPLVRGIHRLLVNSPHKCQWRGALMFSLICARTNGWVNYRKAGDLRRHRAHYDVIVTGKWVKARSDPPRPEGTLPNLCILTFGYLTVIDNFLMHWLKSHWLNK